MIPSEKIRSKLIGLTCHQHIYLTRRGNASIMAVLRHIKKTVNPKKFGMPAILIPDMGGWITYRQYAKKLKFLVIDLPTDSARIDIVQMAKYAALADCILYQDPGGYFVGQPQDEIYRICRSASCAVILDITGSIGYKLPKADYCVCSFGPFKPVSIGTGGFISSIQPIGGIEDEPFSDEQFYSLSVQIDSLKKKYSLWQVIRDKVQKDLSKFSIIHPQTWGINVVVRFKREQEKEKIIKYCMENGLEYALCPRYIRYKGPAVSIEIKRMEV